MACQSIQNTSLRSLDWATSSSFLASLSQYFGGLLILSLQVWLCHLYSSKLPCNCAKWCQLIIWIISLDIHGCLAVLCQSPSAALASPVTVPLKYCQSPAFTPDMAFNLFAMLQLYVAWLWGSCKWNLSSWVLGLSEWSTLSLILIFAIRL